MHAAQIVCLRIIITAPILLILALPRRDTLTTSPRSESHHSFMTATSPVLHPWDLWGTATQHLADLAALKDGAPPDQELQVSHSDERSAEPPS